MKPLLIRAPAHRQAEFAWVCEVLFDRGLGLPFRIEQHTSDRVEVWAGQGCVCWTDVFLAGADAHWLRPQTLPSPALQRLDWPDEALRERTATPELVQPFGDGRLDVGAQHVQLPVDLTGSAFFMLSRYEEAVVGAACDAHGRFPGKASALYSDGLLHRPLVDEGLELLWWALKRVAPQLERALHRPSTWVSCDVDLPFSPGAGDWAGVLRQAASDLLSHRSPRRAGRTLMHAMAGGLGMRLDDPLDTFDWMLDLNERCGQKVTFFFLAVQDPAPIDCRYELVHPRVADLLTRIVGRGHEVGLHGSYATVDQPQRLAGELQRLKDAVHRAGGSQQTFGGRQHYLRWRARGTAAALEAQGLAYDATLGFADAPGFRCGTCRPYPLFDLESRRRLALMERPLVLMEASVIAPGYLGLGLGQEARTLMHELRSTCQRFGGEFSVLWHNSNFVDPRARELYAELIQPL